jgi:hypothetical protein
LNVETFQNGGVAQLGERLPCTQEVIGSIPFTSTIKVDGWWLIADGKHHELSAMSHELGANKLNDLWQLNRFFKLVVNTVAEFLREMIIFFYGQATKGRRRMPWHW